MANGCVPPDSAVCSIAPTNEQKFQQQCIDPAAKRYHHTRQHCTLTHEQKSGSKLFGQDLGLLLIYWFFKSDLVHLQNAVE